MIDTETFEDLEKGIVECEDCGKRNRVIKKKRNRCGSCKQPLISPITVDWDACPECDATGEDCDACEGTGVDA